jgi:hypothetical protein
LLERSRDLLERPGLDVGEDHAHALAGEAFGEGAPHAAGGAGDDRYLVS